MVLPICVALVLGTITCVRADPPHVGDRIELDYITGLKFGHIKEIGTGDHAGQYRITFEDDPTDPNENGFWWTDYKLPAKIFLVDANGKRIKDFHPRPGDPSPTDPGAKSKEFKVGDRVEVFNGTTWDAGTVTSPLEYNRYLVLLDKWVGKGLPDTHAMPSDIRASLRAGKAPQVPAVPTMRPPISAPEQGQAHAGRPPLPLTKKLIQAIWEEQSIPGTTINLDEHSVEIGGTRRWVVNQDIGPGNQHTVIYEVKVRSTKRTYSSGHVVIAEEEGLYKMYIDLFGKWHAGYESSKSLKPLQDIYFK